MACSRVNSSSARNAVIRPRRDVISGRTLVNATVPRDDTIFSNKYAIICSTENSSRCTSIERPFFGALDDVAKCQQQIVKRDGQLGLQLGFIDERIARIGPAAFSIISR